MKTMKSLALILLSCCCVSMAVAQIRMPQIIAETEKARVEVDNGQEKLVIIIGRKADNEVSINLPLSEDVWNSLLSLVRAPRGGDSIQMKDERGQKVEIQKAKVNGEDGLFFLSGSTHVAILNRDILNLHGVSHKPSNNLIDRQGKKSLSVSLAKETFEL